MAKTSWEDAAKWYDKITNEKGHYYHQAVIMPKLKKMLKKSVLDLACGNGALAGNVKCDYVGLDASKTLIRAAQANHPKSKFYTKDVTQPLDLKQAFHFVTCILALQNIAEPLALLKNAHAHLEADGQLILVLNHPCFRIPRQSHWGVDSEKKLQYRRIERYMSEMEIPIQVGRAKLLTFHHPLSFYFDLLKQSGFQTLDVQEWCSDKKSTGAAAKMENRAREEFPLFLTIIAKKC
ncbi:MAG: class I SAM-dependent methyltransferase [Chlamydiia bacterium]|nr:class I SAM-dependent methyltransferase [Chlamydiia bacterium]MCP5509781.1 class I SAM-dependent methyltransferase [Chlamydiales bacterium]HPE84906.1 class I SAM-dependent methyltransferase [Chlamydiales bacterium]